MKKIKNILTKALAIICIITLLPVNSYAFGSRYNPEAAVSNAKNHIARENASGTTCSLVCDQFTKECLSAGGIDVRAGGVEPLMNALVDLGLGTKVNLVVADDGANFNKNDNPRASAGDLLIYYCEECSKYMHVVVVAGFDEDGNMLAYGHNPVWDQQGELVRYYNHRLDNGTQHRNCYQYYMVDMSEKPFSHSHNFTTDKIEKNHPHKMYDECSCGAKYYLGWNARNYSNCAICNGSTTGKPEVVAGITADKGITLEWSAVAGAESYTVKRSKAGGSYFILATDLTGTTFLNSPEKVDKGVQYTYIVTAVTSAGNIDSEPVSIMVPLDENFVLDAPVAAGSVNGTNITITWAKVPNAVEYDIYRSDDGGNTYEFKKTVNTLSYTNVGVAEGTTFYYKVKAVAGNGTESEYSNVVTVTTEDPLPAPTLTIKANSSGKPVLSWTAVEGAANYEVWRATGTGSYTKLTTTPKLTVTNSAAEGDYRYKVRAVKPNGAYGAYSAVVKFTIAAPEENLPAPTLTITANASGKPVLSWTAVEGAAKYEVWRATGTGAYTRLTTVTKLTVTNSAANGTYSYKVRAVKANGTYGDYSDAITFTIGAPVYTAPTLTITANTSGKPVLKWTAVDGATGYEVWRATGTGEYKRLTTTTKLTVTNSAANGTYSYKVRAVKSGGTFGDYSNAETFTIGAQTTAPTLTVKANASGKPVLSWTAVSGATSYEVWRATGTGEYKRLTTTTKLTVTNSASNGTYSYKVRAVKSGGTFGDYSNAETFTVGAASTVPTVTIKLNASGKPVISWTAVNGAAKYELSRATSENGTYKVLTTTPKLTVTNSTTSGTYFYKVRIVKADGTKGAYSTPVKITF